MKLVYDDIIGKHKNKPCILAGHGPSLNPHLQRIQQLQKEEGYLRISVNEWYDFFREKPDYWVVSSTEYTIYNSIAPNWLWDTHLKFEKDVFNKYNIPLLYNDTADLTSDEFIQENLKCDYLPYDAKHFMSMKCIDILNSFKEHYETNKNFDFRKFGNNSEMWKPLSSRGTNCDPSWTKFAGIWRSNNCCHKVDDSRLTVQEELQRISGFSEHMGPPMTAAFFALSFAIMMKCNPIYVAGMDLDYSKGYARSEASNYPHRINSGALGHWKKLYKDIIANDLRIMKESAELLGIEIINLDKESWHNVLPIGEIP